MIRGHLWVADVSKELAYLANPVLEDQVLAGFSRQGFHFGSHEQFFAWEDTETRLGSSHGGQDGPAPLIAHLSLQSPFHSPWPQGFHKRTRFTGLPWLLTWSFTQAINSNGHFWIQQRVWFFIKRRKPTAVTYLFHTCDGVGVALDQSVWQHGVGRSLLQ